MLNNLRYLTLFSMLLGFGCRSNKASQDTGQVGELPGQQDTAAAEEVPENSDSGEPSETGFEEETQPDDTGDKPDDTGDKPDDTGSMGYEECPTDFDSTQPCEGTWMETICLYEGLLWWCDNGAWVNEEEKE